MNVETRYCQREGCNNPIPRRDDSPKRYATRKYCSQGCAAMQNSANLKSGAQKPLRRCECLVPLLPTEEKQCRICELEQMVPTFESPSRRLRRITADPEHEGYVEMFSGTHYVGPSKRSREKTWLDVLLEERTPGVVEEIEA